MDPAPRTRPVPSTGDGVCFLCGRGIAPVDLADAFARTLTDVVPARVERAHPECAFEAGLLEPMDDDGERPR